MKLVHRLILVAALSTPVAALAAGGHDAVGCGGCHSLHAAKGQQLIPAVAPNTKYLNPKTKQPYTGSTAMCLGCHDPHPSNPYYKYLRVDTGAKGDGMDKFCAVCHAMKADATAVVATPFFSSMDEQAKRVVPAVSSAPKAPAATSGNKAQKQ